MTRRIFIAITKENGATCQVAPSVMN